MSGSGEACSNCYYARPVVGDEDQPLFKCYRYPAVLIVINGEVNQALPDAVDWCGEWRRSR